MGEEGVERLALNRYCPPSWQAHAPIVPAVSQTFPQRSHSVAVTLSSHSYLVVLSNDQNYKMNFRIMCQKRIEGRLIRY